MKQTQKLYLREFLNTISLNFNQDNLNIWFGVERYIFDETIL